MPLTARQRDARNLKTATMSQQCFPWGPIIAFAAVIFAAFGGHIAPIIITCAGLFFSTAVWAVREFKD